MAGPARSTTLWISSALFDPSNLAISPALVDCARAASISAIA
jgi:hypothetical protein